MNIPNFIESQVVNEQGYLTDVWKNIFMQLLSQLQINLSDEGYLLPQQSAGNIIILNTAQSEGAIVYNSDTKKVMVNENGTFKTIQTI